MLRVGLLCLGIAGICIALMAMGFATFGPCGPGDPLSMVALLGLVVCVPLGSILILSAGVRVGWRRLNGGPEDPSELHLWEDDHPEFTTRSTRDLQ